MLEKILAYLVPSLLGIFTFLVRSYFNNIHESIEELKLETAKRNGEMNILLKDIKDNTEELMRLRIELNAVWRYMDQGKGPRHG